MIIKNPCTYLTKITNYNRKNLGDRIYVYSPEKLKNHYATLRMIERNWSLLSNFEVIHNV